ncbi:MAG: hypothetical protein ACLS6E_15375 [Lachnospiraceae bacterium]
METNLSNVVEITSKVAKYDASVKEVLADKQVLSRILKYSLEEFKDIELEDIMRSMDEPVVSGIRMEPGQTNLSKIVKYSEEDTVPGEGKIFYDIRFAVYLGEEMIKFLINVEAQKSSDSNKLQYHLDNRIIYYLARMISAQKEVEFEKSNYDDIKPVRSIWICMDANDDEDSINRICLTQRNVYGKMMELRSIDKVQSVIIRLRKRFDVTTSRNYLIAMLEELLKKEDAENKKKNLEEKYGFVMSVKTEGRLNDMCNLGEGLLERGIEEGIEQGIEQGLEQGKAEGLRSLVETVKSLVGDDFQKVCEIIRKNDVYANASDEEIRKYW